MQLIQRSFASVDKQTHQLLVTGFYEANDIPDRDNFRAMSQIVVDKISEFYGVEFGVRNEFYLTQARGLPNGLAKGTKIRYECRQQVRYFPASLKHYSITRIRRRKLIRYSCGGQISVYFLNRQTDAAFDFAIDYEHALHPGASHFGVPKVVRDWIRDNPRPTPLAQREDLLAAIEKGEIAGVIADRYLSPSHISYWWRKGVAQTIYVSPDKWENVVHILQDNPGVYALYL